MMQSVSSLHKRLPRTSHVGNRSTYALPVGKDATETINIAARFIGLGSSVRDRHQNHRDGAPHAEPKMHCNACRWFETRIFRLVTEHDEDSELAGANYVLHHSGVSIVPNEVVYYRYEVLRSGFEVIEALTIRKNDSRGNPQPPFLTRPAARALSQAAGYDTELREAYVNRATA